MNVLQEAREIENEIIETRRTIHMNPELAYNEYSTSRLVVEKLESYGVEVRSGIGGTGVLGIIHGRGNGKTVALRADMDALPVEEKTGLSFSSKNKGVMHACGHDTHVAMLLGAAKILSKYKDRLQGSVKLIFQPAEEHGGRGGAKPMIEQGVMENPKVDYVFGLHISSRIPSFTFGLREGPFMAAPDQFTIRIVGRGGHGSEPNRTVDPIYVTSHLILALQGISSRMVDPVEPFVISVGKVSSGTKSNIIPDDSLIEGTIRTLTKETRERAIELVKKITEHVCNAFGASSEVSFQEDTYPVLVNEPSTTRKVRQVLSSIENSTVLDMEPVLGGEDFARFLEKAPGTFYYLGTYNEQKGCVYPNHSSKFMVDEEVLKYGTASHVALALEFTRQ